ncbi:90 kDa surface protein [Trypanosoma cruzi Dm28c]|uniref:90 kDa surface protein n=1 Tax=Trypanosoma cruzi Dm28c TaxID=1416333 RepID=V5D331_TRYCR|nr:90 kDa surface protein [Trypanosoma cruzi Dm28c]
MICEMGVGNCAPEDVEKRIKDGVNDGFFTINVTSPTPDILKSWWERNVEDVTVASVPAKPPAARTPGPQEHKAPGDATKKNSVSHTAGAEVAAGAPSLDEAPGDSGEIVPAKPLEEETPSPQEDKISRETSSRTDSESSPAVVENSTDVPPPPPPATPGGAGANPAAGAAATTDPSAAASQASDSAPSGDPQGAAHSASAASPAPESIPDPEPTEGGGHSSHDPPVELQEETAAAPPTQLSQTGEDGGAAEAPKRTPPPTPPTLLPAKEILRRQACRLPFPLRPQRTHWRTVWELTPASMAPVCMPCHRLFWLRSPTGHWAEEVNAGYKCQHSTTWICELLLFYCVIINRK